MVTKIYMTHTDCADKLDLYPMMFQLLSWFDVYVDLTEIRTCECV